MNTTCSIGDRGQLYYNALALLTVVLVEPSLDRVDSEHLERPGRRGRYRTRLLVTYPRGGDRR